MVSIKDYLILGTIGLGAFTFLTVQGKRMFEDVTGFEAPDLGFEYDFSDILDVPAIELDKEEKSGYSPRDIRDMIRENADYHFPIQDLYVPKDYYKFKYETDTNRVPSPEFADWYAKGSGLIPEDYYEPKHYLWNPDYYYYFGNLYRRWYPNIYDIRDPPRRVPYWFGEVYY